MSLRKSVYWSLAGNWASFVLSIASTVIVARLLTPTQMGVFTLSNAIMWMILGALGQGLSRYVFLGDVENRRKMGTVVVLSLLQGLLVSLALLIAAPLIGQAKAEPELTTVILILAAIPPFSVLEGVWRASLSLELRFGRLMGIAVGRAAVGSTVTISMAWAGFGPVSLAVGMLAASVYALVATCLAARKSFRFEPSLQHAREILRFLRDSSLIGGAYAINGKLPDLILGSHFPLSTLGHWGRAVNSVDMLRAQVIDPMGRVQTPAMAREYNAGRPMAGPIEKFNQIFAAVFWPLLALLAVLAKPAIGILLGPQWTLAAQIVPILCLYNLISLAAMGASETWMLTHQLHKNVRFEIVRGCILAACIFFGLRFGLLGVAKAMLIEAAFVCVWKFFVLVRIGGASLASLLKGTAQGLLLSAVAALPAFVVMSMSGWPAMLPIWQLAAIGITGALCWLATAFLLGHPLADEVSSQFRRLVTQLKNKLPAPRNS